MVFDAVAQHESRMISMEPFRQIIERFRAVHVTDGESAAGEGGSSVNCPMIQYPENCPTLKEAERSLIREALRRANGNQGIAANLLGISRQALNRRLLNMFSLPSEANL